MNAEREFENLIDDWLAVGPTRAPDRILSGVLEAVPSVRQRRFSPSITWPLRSMEPHVRAIAITALAVVLFAGGVAIFTAPSDDLGASSPSASSAASPAASASSEPSAAPSPGSSAATGSIDTSAWIAFTSARYGFSARYPGGWTAIAARTSWQIVPTTDPLDSTSTRSWVDSFASPDGPIFAVVSQPLPAGVSAEQWLAGFEGAGATKAFPECWPVPSAMTRLTVDGVPGWVRTGCGATDVFAFVGGRVYDLWVEIDPTLNRPLFDAFLSTVRFTPWTAHDGPASSRPSATPRG